MREWNGSNLFLVTEATRLLRFHSSHLGDRSSRAETSSTTFPLSPPFPLLLSLFPATIKSCFEELHLKRKRFK